MFVNTYILLHKPLILPHLFQYTEYAHTKVSMSVETKVYRCTRYFRN